jgi:hypothetical protein
MRRSKGNSYEYCHKQELQSILSTKYLFNQIYKQAEVRKDSQVVEDIQPTH